MGQADRRRQVAAQGAHFDDLVQRESAPCSRLLRLQFQKEQDFLLVAPGNDALNSKTKAALGI